MLNRDTLFGKREAPTPREIRNVNVTPALGAHGHDTGTTRVDTTPPLPERPKTVATPPSASRLIVGPAIKLKGVEITDCDTLVVEGTVEASMDSRVVQIAEHGVFTGKVSIDIAEIHGRFDGELTARDQLIIHATGRVSGKIRYGKIKIEEGAEISGDVARLETRPLRSAAPVLKTAGATDQSIAEVTRR